MHCFSARLLAGLMLGVLLVSCGEPEDSRPGQPVKHRRQAFSAILKAFEPMGVMLRKDRYDEARFAQFAQQLIERRDGPWSHFGPDTHYPPSKSTPAVWDKPQQFEQEKQAFIQSTDALMAAVATRDKARIAIAYDQVHDTCKHCHDTFKQR